MDHGNYLLLESGKKGSLQLHEDNSNDKKEGRVDCCYWASMLASVNTSGSVLEMLLAYI